MDSETATSTTPSPPSGLMPEILSIQSMVIPFFETLTNTQAVRWETDEARLRRSNSGRRFFGAVVNGGARIRAARIDLSMCPLDENSGSRLRGERPHAS